MENTNTLRNEAEKVSNFIDNWREKNEYNPLFLEEYNNKFNAEFNHFLKNSNFSEETIKMFES